MGLLWIGGIAVWFIGLYAFVWLDTRFAWPPPMPVDLFGWLTWSAIFIGPPLAIFLVTYGITSTVRAIQK